MGCFPQKARPAIEWVCESVCVCLRGGYYKWDSSFLGRRDGNNFPRAFTVIWIVLLKQIWLHISFERYSNWLCFKLPSNTGALCSPAELITGPWSSSLTGCGRTLSTSFLSIFFPLNVSLITPLYELRFVISISLDVFSAERFVFRIGNYD